MESFGKIKQILHVFAVLLFFIVCSCKTPSIPPLVLQEIAPLPVIARPVVVTEYEPIYSIMRIIEVSEVNGVQRFFIVRSGADRTNIARDAVGEIAMDATFQQIIGSYKIIELQGDFFRCEITELTHRIGTNAHIRLQVGEKEKAAQ